MDVFNSFLSLSALISFGVGIIVGCIIMTLLLVFVVKEGQEILPSHHIHHHGEEDEDEYDPCR